MKKNLLVVLALLATGFGARQVFLLAEDWKGRSQTAHRPVVEIAAAQNQVADVPIPIAEVPIVEPEITPVETIQPQTIEPPVTRPSDTKPQDDTFYFLLHPDRKENPVTEEATKATDAIPSPN